MNVDDWSRPAVVVGRSSYGVVAACPIACFILAFLTDLAYWATVSTEWETFSVWLLALGLVVAALAVVAGLVDLVRSRRVRGLAQPPLRLVGHLVAALFALVNVFVHSRDGYTAVVPQGLILSALTVLVLIATALVGRSRNRASTREYA